MSSDQLKAQRARSVPLLMQVAVALGVCLLVWAGAQTLTGEVARLVVVATGVAALCLTAFVLWRARSGDTIRILGIEFDSSVNERSAEKLRISELLLSEAGALAKFGGWQVDLETMTPLWTDEVYRIHELEPIGTPVSLEQAIAFYAPEAQAIISDAVKQSIADGCPYDLELPLKTAKGNKRWVRTIGKPQFDGSRCVALRGCFQDITERRRVQDELQMLNERLRLATECSHLGVWELNLRTQKLSWDESMFRLFGRDPADCHGTALDWESCVVQEDRPMVLSRLQETIDQRRPLDVEYQILTGNGETRIIHSVARIHCDESGDDVRLIGTSADVTEKRRAEDIQERLRKELQQAQKMEAVGTLAGGIAHDFNNILGSIVGFTELARIQRHDPTKVQGHTEAVLAACDRAKQVIRQMLAFSRRDDAQERNPVVLSKLVADSCRLLRAGLPPEVEIRFQGASNECQIRANETQIHQVVMNLVTNASQAIERSGTIELEIQRRNLSEPTVVGSTNIPRGEYLELSVTDSGPGIDPTIVDRIFEPFFTTKGPGQGSGLGLSVVHGIVSENQGRIAVETALGKGTRFRIFFPICDSGSSERDVSVGHGVNGAGSFVLILEDELSLGESIRLYLEANGYKADLFPSPSPVLALGREHLARYSAVLSDYSMPGMNGVDFVRELRGMGLATPIILETGFLGDIDPRVMNALGIARVLQKPVLFPDLLAALQGVLHASGATSRPDTGQGAAQ